MTRRAAVILVAAVWTAGISGVVVMTQDDAAAVPTHTCPGEVLSNEHQSICWVRAVEVPADQPTGPAQP